MTPEHKAAETALHVAIDRIMRAETELRAWRWMCAALVVLAAVGIWI